MQNNKPLPPVMFFIFGGSGDLNQRKLTPALYNLFLDGAMPQKFSIVGIARSDYDDASYKKHLLEGIENFSRRKDENNKWSEFADHISYLKLDAANANDYAQLNNIVPQKEQEFNEHPSIIFYMAVAPQIVPDIIKNLSSLSFCSDTKCTRIVIEKPFGHDL